MSDESLKKIAKGISLAAQSEREGQHFYLMAAQSAQDAKGREVFEQLAQEEFDHAVFLEKQYRFIVETGEPSKKLKLGKPLVLSETNPIFSDKIKSRLKNAHFEMTALSVGAQLELDAQKFYKERADETDDLVIKSFYLELADWEAGHYRALMAQQETLKEAYFTDNGFAPF
jgi:rubrerythrin